MAIQEPDDAVESALRRAIRDLDIPAERVKPHARMQEDLELDSTELVQLSLDVSRALGVKVRLDTGNDITFDEACALIRNRLVPSST